MPLYDYRCDECGKQFEKRLGFSQSDTLVVCPTCESQRTHRLISAVMILGAAGPVADDGGCGCGGACNCH